MRQIKTDFYKVLNDRAFTTAYIFLEEDEFPPNLYKTVKERYLRTLTSEVSLFFDSENNPAFLGLSDEVSYSNELINHIRDQEYYEFKDGDRRAVGIYYRDNQGDFVIIVSAIDVNGRNHLNNLFWTLLLGFMLSVIVLFLVGRLFATQALKPISRVVNQVNNISVSNLDVRLDEGNKVDEIAELSATFNKMLDRFEESFNVQQRFVANASHELRTPLTSMIGEIEVALEKERSPKDYVEVLNSIHQDALTLHELTTGLLNLAEAESEKIYEMLQPIRVDEVVIEAVMLIEKQYPKATIKVNYLIENVEEDDFVIPANRALLFNTFANILDNALKYSPDNQTVELAIDASDTKIEFTIKDFGIGIAENDISNIYDPFYRSSDATLFKGFGIGLSLVKRVLSIVNGEIQISSMPGEGTTVTVYFMK